MIPRRLHPLLVCSLPFLLAGACGPRGRQPAGGPSASPTARPELVDTLRRDLEVPRHAADGGGRAWLEEGAGTGPVQAGRPGRWTLVYEAGPPGIAEGGMLFLQVSPFWGWSTPQVERPDLPGFTRVTTEAAGVELEPATAGQQLLAVRIRGRGLAAGERVRFVYGAGDAGAFADRYAEAASPFWFAVDGDGDGVRAVVAGSPTVEVAPGPPAQMVLTLPSTAAPGERIRLTVAILDAVGNAGIPFEGEITLTGGGEGLSSPPTLTLRPGDGGRRSVEISAEAEGVYRLQARAAGGLEAESGPLLVAAGGERVLWGDLHGHSALSDGTGTPEGYFRYARDVAALDVAALTDHDHWGIRPLARHPEMWEEIRRQVERFHEPGRFVTLLGYEWTSWLHGHRHVLYFRDRGRVLSSLDPAFDHPRELWAALRGEQALTFAHHSAGGPVATNWDIPPDPELEPVTEVASVHGASEAPDAPHPIYDPVAGNFVRDALDRGYELGFIGSGDSHDGHPGLAHLAAASSGLAAILSHELSRRGVLEALRERRVYATNGPRILLRVTVDGEPMGSRLAPGAGKRELAALAVGTAPLERLEIIRSGTIVETVEADGATSLPLRRTLTGLAAGEYLYLRVIQVDGGAAWSSPFFVGER